MARGARNKSAAPPPEKPTRQSRRLRSADDGDASPLQQLPSPHRGNRARKTSDKATSHTPEPDQATEVVDTQPAPVSPVAESQDESQSPPALETEDEPPITTTADVETSRVEVSVQIPLIETGSSPPSEHDSPVTSLAALPAQVSEEADFIAFEDNVSTESSPSASSDNDSAQSDEHQSEAAATTPALDDLPPPPTIESQTPQPIVIEDLVSEEDEPQEQSQTQDIYNYIQPRRPDANEVSATEAPDSKAPSPLRQSSPAASDFSFDSLFDELPESSYPEPNPESPNAPVPTHEVRDITSTSLISLEESPITSPVSFSPSISTSSDSSYRRHPVRDVIEFEGPGYLSIGEGRPSIDMHRHKSLILELDRYMDDPAETASELHLALRKNSELLEFFRNMPSAERFKAMDLCLRGENNQHICYDTKLLLLFIDRIKMFSNARELVELATILYQDGVALTNKTKKLRSSNRAVNEEMEELKAALAAQIAEKESERAKRLAAEKQVEELQQTPVAASPVTPTPKPSSRKRRAPSAEEESPRKRQVTKEELERQKRVAWSHRKERMNAAEAARIPTEAELDGYSDEDEHATSKMHNVAEAYEKAITKGPSIRANQVNSEYKKIVKGRFQNRKDGEDMSFSAYLNKRTPETTPKKSPASHPIGAYSSPFQNDISMSESPSAPAPADELEPPQTPTQNATSRSWGLRSIISSVSKVPNYFFGSRTPQSASAPTIPVAPQTAPVRRVGNSITSQEDVDRIFDPPASARTSSRPLLEDSIGGVSRKSGDINEWRRMQNQPRRAARRRPHERQSIILAAEKRNQINKDIEAEEMGHEPGQKRKRVKLSDLKHIPNPAGCSYGLNPDFFDHGSDSEPEVDVEEDVSLFTPPRTKRVRFADDTYSPGVGTDRSKPPGSPHSSVFGDPHHARPYNGKLFTDSSPSTSPTPGSGIFSADPNRATPYTGTMFGGPNSSAKHQGGNLFASPQSRDAIKSPGNDAEATRDNPEFNREGHFEVPDESDTESEASFLTGTANQFATSSSSKQSSSASTTKQSAASPRNPSSVSPAKSVSAFNSKVDAPSTAKSALASSEKQTNEKNASPFRPPIKTPNLFAGQPSARNNIFGSTTTADTPVTNPSAAKTTLPKPLFSSPTKSTGEPGAKLFAVEPGAAKPTFAFPSTAATATGPEKQSASPKTSAAADTFGAILKANEAPAVTETVEETLERNREVVRARRDRSLAEARAIVAAAEKKQQEDAAAETQGMIEQKESATASSHLASDDQHEIQTPAAAEDTPSIPPAQTANQAPASNDSSLFSSKAQTLTPPPKPTPSHASLPPAEPTSQNGEYALARARSQAEKYKPKQPSGLRASSRLSNSTVASEGGDQDPSPQSTSSGAEVTTPPNSTPNGVIDPRLLNHANTPNGMVSPLTGAAVAKENFAVSLSLSEWDDEIEKATQQYEAKLRGNLTAAEFKEVMDLVNAVPESELRVFTFPDPDPVYCPPEVDAAVRAALATPEGRKYAETYFQQHDESVAAEFEKGVEENRRLLRGERGEIATHEGVS